jgi:hypothetical protein
MANLGLVKDVQVRMKIPETFSHLEKIFHPAHTRFCLGCFLSVRESKLIFRNLVQK